MDPRRITRGGFGIAATIGALVALPGPALAGGGCHGGATQGEGSVVAMRNACFTPSVLQVEPGTEVTFVNEDEVVHNISATGWGSDRDMLEGDTIAATFREEGTYPYACTYHYGMTGAVVVGDGSGAGSGASVDATTVRDLLPVSQARQPSAEPSAPKAPLAGYGIAGGIGLLLGTGVGMLRRPRRA